MKIILLSLMLLASLDPVPAYSWGDQAQGSGHIENANGDNIGSYSTDYGGAWLTINGEEGIWTVPAFAYYFPNRQNPNYRIFLSCMASGPDGCIRWRMKLERKINGEWVEDVGAGNNQLVKD